MKFIREAVSIEIDDPVITTSHSKEQQDEIWSRVEPILKDEFADIHEHFAVHNLFKQYPANKRTDIVLGSGLDEDFQANLPWIAGYLNFRSTALLHAFATTGTSGEILREYISYAGKFIHSRSLDFIDECCGVWFVSINIPDHGNGSKAGSLHDMMAKYFKSAWAMVALYENVFTGTQPGVEKDHYWDWGIELEDLYRFEMLVRYVQKSIEIEEPEWSILPIWLTDEVQNNDSVVSKLTKYREIRRAWCQDNLDSMAQTEEVKLNHISKYRDAQIEIRAAQATPEQRADEIDMEEGTRKRKMRKLMG